MVNDVDIIVGVKDVTQQVLSKISANVDRMALKAKAFTSAFSLPANTGLDRAVEQLNDRLAKGAGMNGGAMAAPISNTKALETAIAAASAKVDQAVVNINRGIDSTNAKIQSTISSISNFVNKAATIATVSTAFYTMGKEALGAATKTDRGLTSAIGKISMAAGAFGSLAQSTISATNAQNGLITRFHSLTRAAASAYILRDSLKRVEEGSKSAVSGLSRILALSLAIDTATRATLRFGLGLVGLRRNADQTTTALSRVGTVSSRALTNVNTGFASASVAAAGFASKIDELPKGAEVVNTAFQGLANVSQSIQGLLWGIPGAALAAAAGIGGLALAAVTAAQKTERQLNQLTNKLAIIEAAKLNISIDQIDTRPLRAVAEEAERIAKRIQTATNIQSSKLLSLAINNLPKGLDGNQIGDAMKAAVGLSEVYGTSIEDGMYRVRQAIDGNFEGFERLIPKIKEMATNEEKLAAVSLLASNGFKVMHREALTFWGTIDRVRNGLGNVLESLGRMRSLADVVATVIRDVATPAVEYLDSKLKGFGFDGSKVLDQVTEFGAGVLAAIDVLQSNWETLWTRLDKSTELFWEKTKNHAENFINTVAPWVSSNLIAAFDHAFGRIGQGWRDNAAYAMTAVQESLGQVPAGTLDVLRDTQNRANRTPFQPTPFSALSVEPSAAQREIEKQISQLDTTIATSFDSAFAKNLETLRGMIKADSLAIDPNINLQPNAPKVDQAAEVAKTASLIDVIMPAVQSRFLTRGDRQEKGVDIARKTQENTAAMVKEMQELLKEVREANRKEAKNLAIGVKRI